MADRGSVFTPWSTNNRSGSGLGSRHFASDWPEVPIWEMTPVPSCRALGAVANPAGHWPTSRSQSGATSGYRRRSVNNGPGTARELSTGTVHQAGDGCGVLSSWAARAPRQSAALPISIGAGRLPNGLSWSQDYLEGNTCISSGHQTPSANVSRTLAALPPGIFKIHRSCALWDGG
jgi:hypothetical protein